MPPRRGVGGRGVQQRREPFLPPQAGYSSDDPVKSDHQVATGRRGAGRWPAPVVEPSTTSSVPPSGYRNLPQQLPAVDQGVDMQTPQRSCPAPTECSAGSGGKAPVAPGGGTADQPPAGRPAVSFVGWDGRDGALRRRDAGRCGGRDGADAGAHRPSVSPVRN